MAAQDHENVPVAVRTKADGQTVQFGVVVDGGFFPFHEQTASSFADDYAEATGAEAPPPPGP